MSLELSEFVKFAKCAGNNTALCVSDNAIKFGNKDAVKLELGDLRPKIDDFDDKTVAKNIFIRQQLLDAIRDHFGGGKDNDFFQHAEQTLFGSNTSYDFQTAAADLSGTTVKNLLVELGILPKNSSQVDNIININSSNNSNIVDEIKIHDKSANKGVSEIKAEKQSLELNNLTEAQKNVLFGSQRTLRDFKTGEKQHCDFKNLELAPDGKSVLCEVLLPGKKPTRVAILENGVLVARALYEKGLRPTVKQSEAVKGLDSKTLFKTLKSFKALKTQDLPKGEKLTLSQDYHAGPDGSLRCDVLCGGKRVGAVWIEPNGKVHVADPVTDLMGIDDQIRKVVEADDKLKRDLRNNPVGATQLYNALANDMNAQRLFATNDAFRKSVARNLQDGCEYPLPVGKFSVPFSKQAQTNLGNDIHQMVKSKGKKSSYGDELSSVAGETDTIRIKVNGDLIVLDGLTQEAIKNRLEEKLFKKIGVKDEGSKVKVMSLLHQAVLGGVAMMPPTVIESLSLPKRQGKVSLSKDKPTVVNFITKENGGLRCEYDVNMDVAQLGGSYFDDTPSITYNSASSNLHLGFGFDLRRPGGSSKLQTENFAAIGKNVEFDLTLHGEQS